VKAHANLDRQIVALDVDDTVHLLVELTAPPAPNALERPPLDLVAVLDRSGSMSGDPLEGVKAAAELLVRLLGPADRLAVVTFDGEVALELPLAHHGDEALAVIRGISVGGSTNLSGGWLKAREVLADARTDATRRIVLLTDGEANVGITGADALADLAHEAAEGGITTTTIGYVVHVDEEGLAAMAAAGRGNTYWSAGADETPQIFGQEFDGLAAVVAQNVSVEIRPSDSVQVVGVLNDYRVTTVDGGVQVAVGDAFADETRRVVAKLWVPGLSALGPVVIAEVVLRYVLIGGSVQQHTVTFPILVNVGTGEEARAVAQDASVVEEVSTLLAARTRRAARRAINEGRTDDAQSLLRSGSVELRLAASSVSDPAKLLADAEAMDQAATDLEGDANSASTAKEMWSLQMTASTGRSTRAVGASADDLDGDDVSE
jgi:Ca-activated chloride channel family protein